MEAPHQKAEQDELENVVNLSCVSLTSDVATLHTIDTPFQTSIFGTFQLNGRLIRFQLDSGASCNAVKKSDIDLTQESLRPTSQALRVYNGVIMLPLGQVQGVLYNPINGATYQATFVVVADASTSIPAAKAC